MQLISDQLPKKQPSTVSKTEPEPRSSTTPPDDLQSHFSRRYWWDSKAAEPIVIGILVFVVWIGFLAIFTDNLDQLIFGAVSSENNNAGQSTCSGDDVGAYVMAQEDVKIMLQNSSNAVFSYSSKDRLVREDSIYIYHVASWVDATNSFGGTIRRRWAMVLRKNFDGSWERIDGPIFE